MSLKKILLLLTTHLFIAILGFAVGIFSLPIMIAPPSPALAEIEVLSKRGLYKAEFNKDLKGSDLLHWGQGQVSIGEDHVTFIGELSPGPDFKLYLSPEFVETEVEFERLKSTMRQVGDVDTFSNFVVELPQDIQLAQYNSVIVWCESFGQFITAARFR